MCTAHRVDLVIFRKSNPVIPYVEFGGATRRLQSHSPSPQYGILSEDHNRVPKCSSPSSHFWCGGTIPQPHRYGIDADANVLLHRSSFPLLAFGGPFFPGHRTMSTMGAIPPGCCCCCTSSTPDGFIRNELRADPLQSILGEADEVSAGARRPVTGPFRGHGGPRTAPLFRA